MKYPVTFAENGRGSFCFLQLNLKSTVLQIFCLHNSFISLRTRSVGTTHTKISTMQFYPHLLLPFIGLASSTCNHDNCARALMGVHLHGTTVTSDCSSFLDTTIVPPVSTTSVTITSVIDTTTTIQPAKRQEIATIPAYATGVCLDAAVYASACSCLGVTPATITAPIPVSTHLYEEFTI
jgi:hypothetical protein